MNGSATEYRVAVVGSNGEFVVLDTFAAASNEAANSYADRYYGEYEWFVLDAAGRNINGGLDG